MYITFAMVETRYRTAAPTWHHTLHQTQKNQTHEKPNCLHGNFTNFTKL